MKEKTKENVNEVQKGKRKIAIAVVIIAIIFIIYGCIMYVLNSKKMEAKLDPTPSNYYEQSNNYVIYNNKIYYYSIDSENRGRIYSMEFDGNDNKLVCSSEYLKTPEFLYAYQNNIYCTSVTGTTMDSKTIMKVDLKSGNITNIQESELPFKINTLEEDKNKYQIVMERHEIEEPTKIITVNDKVIFDFNCNVVSKNALNGIGIYDSTNDTYKKYDNIKHYDVDRDNNCVYIVDSGYQTVNIDL